MGQIVPHRHPEGRGSGGIQRISGLSLRHWTVGFDMTQSRAEQLNASRMENSEAARHCSAGAFVWQQGPSLGRNMGYLQMETFSGRSFT